MRRARASGSGDRIGLNASPASCSAFSSRLSRRLLCASALCSMVKKVLFAVSGEFDVQVPVLVVLSVLSAAALLEVRVAIVNDERSSGSLRDQFAGNASGAPLGAMEPGTVQ